jgi:hypothetical protein
MIRKREKNGETRLFIDIWYRKKDGSKARYRKDASVQTMAAARAEERRILANITLHGEPFEPGAAVEVVEEQPAQEIYTFSQAVTDFGLGKALSKLKVSTRRAYDSILDSRLVPRFGDTAIDLIDHAAVTKLDAEMVEEGLTPSSRRNVQIVLRSVLKGAVESGHMKELPKLPGLPQGGAPCSRFSRAKRWIVSFALLRPTSSSLLLLQLSRGFELVKSGVSSGRTSTLRRARSS